MSYTIFELDSHIEIRRMLRATATHFYTPQELQHITTTRFQTALHKHICSSALQYTPFFQIQLQPPLCNLKLTLTLLVFSQSMPVFFYFIYVSRTNVSLSYFIYKTCVWRIFLGFAVDISKVGALCLQQTVIDVSCFRQCLLGSPVAQ